ncbi:MAG: zinc-dependent peptidase, partial [Rubrivivax sp.]
MPPSSTCQACSRGRCAASAMPAGYATLGRLGSASRPPPAATSPPAVDCRRGQVEPLRAARVNRGFLRLSSCNARQRAQVPGMPLLICFAVVLLAAGAMALWPLWVRRRRERLAAQPFPAAWRRLLRRHVPLVSRLPARQQLRLKGLMQVFLAEKPILGCGGLRVTDEVRVTIAALACLPLLGAARGVYPELRQVLVYPGAFVVDRPVTESGGVLSDQRRVLAGESWSQGQVLLAWDEVKRGAATPGDGHNVVIHEFAHQLDQAGGPANGAPALPNAEAYRRWSTVMQNEFDA